MTGLFSGILYNSFAHDMYYPDIENLRDLDASGLVISLASIALTDLFDDDNNSTIMRNLRGKLRYGENAVAIDDAAYYRNGSGFIKENNFPGLNAKYIDVDGGPLLHLVKECPGRNVARKDKSAILECAIRLLVIIVFSHTHINIASYIRCILLIVFAAQTFDSAAGNKCVDWSIESRWFNTLVEQTGH